MSEDFSVEWNARKGSAAAVIIAGQCVVKDAAGFYIPATSANRTALGNKRSAGFARTGADDQSPVFGWQFVGLIPKDLVPTVGAGAQGEIVRVSSAGYLERVATPGVSDDVVGYADADGTVYCLFGGLLSTSSPGDGGAGGASGKTTKAMNNANRSLTAEEAALAEWRFTTTPAFTNHRTCTIPSVALEVDSYVRIVQNDCTGPFNLILTTGSGTVVELDPGQQCAVEVSPGGVSVKELLTAGYFNVTDVRFAGGAKRYPTLTAALAGTAVDSTAAFEAAMVAMKGTSTTAEGQGGTLHVPKGYYRIKGVVDWEVSGKILGSGGSQRFIGSTLVFDDARNIIFHSYANSPNGGRCDGLIVENIAFRGPNAAIRTLAGSVDGGVVVRSQAMIFRNCSFVGFDGAGMHVDGNLADGYFANHLGFYDCYWSDNTTDGIYIHGGNSNACAFVNCQSGYNSKDRAPSFVFQVAAAGPTYTDITAAITNSTGGDSSPFPAGEVVGDSFMIGYPITFTKLRIDNSAGVRGVNPSAPGTALVWEYWTQDYQSLAGSSDSISNATNASPIAITTTLAHGRATGDVVYITGVLGNTAANGHFICTVTGANTLTLNGTTGNGTYTSGGKLFTAGSAGWLPLASKFLHSIDGDSGGLLLNDLTHVQAADRWIYWEEMTAAENGQNVAWDPVQFNNSGLQYWIRARIALNAYSVNPTIDQIWVAHGAGFNDSSFLGNTYFNCATEGNATPWRLTGGTNRCMIDNPYMELDQGPCKLVPQCVVVGSGMEGRTGISQHTRISTVSCSPLTTVNPLNPTATITSGLGYHDTAMVAQRWKRSGSNYEFRLYYDATASANRWVCQWTGDTEAAYEFTEEGHAQGAGWCMFRHGFLVGAGTRIINFLNAVPASTSRRLNTFWKQGDVIFNQDASPTVPFAWSCIADGSGGTPEGTWQRVYAPQRGYTSALSLASGNVTLSDAQQQCSVIVLTGTLTADRSVFFNVPADADAGRVFCVDAKNVAAGAGPYNVIARLDGSVGTSVTITPGTKVWIDTRTTGVEGP